MYTIYGSGVVWDLETNGPLCKFSNGVFQTEDMQLYNKLIAMGYERDITEKAEKETKKESMRKKVQTETKEDVIPDGQSRTTG